MRYSDVTGDSHQVVVRILQTAKELGIKELMVDLPAIRLSLSFSSSGYDADDHRRSQDLAVPPARPEPQGAAAVSDETRVHGTSNASAIAREGAHAREDDEPTGVPVSSSMAGIYFAQPDPSSPPFVEVGQYVEAGQTLALIEVMKTFSVVASPAAGRIHRILCANGELVEYGQTLFFLTPA
jgi:acetyl-CoA carboxylase biotin carboxyl carrier protein